MAVEEEQLAPNKMMNAGIVANVVTGQMNVELVEVVLEEEADQETVEADLRKYNIKLIITKFPTEGTDTREEEVQVEDAAEVDLEKEDPES